MLTKARIAGHPIHPALVAFPIALYAATVVALLVNVGTHDVFWYRAAMWANLAGVVMALAAAAPGAIDLLSLPRHSRARVTGVRHAGFNVLALVLFAISAAILWRNLHTDAAEVYLDSATPLALCVVGLLSALTASMLGWTLVQNHHVGVRPMVQGAARDHADHADHDVDELAVRGSSVVELEATHVSERIFRH